MHLFFYILFVKLVFTVGNKAKINQNKKVGFFFICSQLSLYVQVMSNKYETCLKIQVRRIYSTKNTLSYDILFYKMLHL